MLDHGILNIPLSKRGNIDAQIDRFKADQRRQAEEIRKAKRAQHADDKAKALEMIEALSDERAQELMTRFSMTRKQLTAALKRQAHYTPSVILRGI